MFKNVESVVFVHFLFIVVNLTSQHCLAILLLYAQSANEIGEETKTSTPNVVHLYTFQVVNDDNYYFNQQVVDVK
jgi:hypothetical protein